MITPENLHKAARIVIVNPDGSLIFHRRPSDDQNAPNKLCLIGGKFDSTDRTRKHAAQREVIEELGIQPQLGELLYFFSRQNADWFTYVFILQLAQPFDPSQLPDHHEFTEVVAIKPDEIPPMFDELAFDHAEILRHYLQFREETL